MVMMILSAVCFALGIFFLLSGVVGIWRMPDFFARLHPAGMIDAMAAPFILLGVMLLHGWSLFTGKLLLLTFFLFITGPTVTHVAAKAAYLCKIKSAEKKEKLVKKKKA